MIPMNCFDSKTAQTMRCAVNPDRSCMAQSCMAWVWDVPPSDEKYIANEPRADLLSEAQLITAREAVKQKTKEVLAYFLGAEIIRKQDNYDPRVVRIFASRPNETRWGHCGRVSMVVEVNHG